jgi:hypothetical protein
LGAFEKHGPAVHRQRESRTFDVDHPGPADDTRKLGAVPSPPIPPFDDVRPQNRKSKRRAPIGRSHTCFVASPITGAFELESFQHQIGIMLEQEVNIIQKAAIR